MGNAHVGDVVAERVYHGMVGGVLGAGDELDRLHHVGVAADDMVDTLADEPLGERLLLGTGVALVLVAPMYEGDDGIGLHGAGTAYVGRELVAAEAVDDVGWGGGDAIGAIGATEEGDAQAVLLDDERIALGAVGGIAIGAYGGERGAIDKGEGALETPSVAVEAMVVGRGKDIEPCIFHGQEVLVGGAKLGIATVGGAAKGDLEVANGDIGSRDALLHQGEAMAIVVVAIGTAGGIDLCLVLHEVAHEEEPHLLWGGVI